MTEDQNITAAPKAEAAEAPPPPKLPAQYWTLVDFGILTQEEAVKRWQAVHGVGERNDFLE